MAYESIRRLLKDGYPYKIIGNGGYEAVLVDTQRLVNHEYCGIYRYPGGTACHDLESIKSYFTVLEQIPSELINKDRELEQAWDQFTDIPMNPETEEIEESFLFFPVGTPREDIWHWFDEHYSKGVAHLLYR